MKASPKSAFLVNSSDTSVFILVEGKANFLNANTFKQFIDKSLSKTFRIISSILKTAQAWIAHFSALLLG